MVTMSCGLKVGPLARFHLEKGAFTRVYKRYSFIHTQPGFLLLGLRNNNKALGIT